MIIGQIFASESGVSHFIALAGVTPANIAINDISLKTRFCGLHFCYRKYWRIFNHFYVIRPLSYRIRLNYTAVRAYAVEGHPRSPTLVPIESSCDFLLVINTNLAPILHRFWDITIDRSKIAIFGYPSCVYLPRRRASPVTISVKFYRDVSRWPPYQMV